MDNRYIPTLDEVRGAWIALTHAETSFDRWLEMTLQETQIAERERIIKLLEDWQDAVMGSDNPVYMVMPINVAIALIKGENK